MADKGGDDKKPQPHPVAEQLPGVQLCPKNAPSGWSEAIVLGFQHYLLSLGITVLIPSMIVPLMGGGDDEKTKVIQSTLFAMGLTTFFQTVFGTRLPVVAVGSYAYMIPATSIALGNKFASQNPHKRFAATMRGMQGALIMAALFQVVMGFFGFWRSAVRFLSPLSVAPWVTFTGLGLYYHGFPMFAKCIEIGLPAIILMVCITQYVPSFVQSTKLLCDRYGLLLTVPLIWFYAQLLTSSNAYDHKPENTQLSCRTDRAGLVSSAPWVSFPHPFHWGSPTFDAGDAFMMMAASLVSLFESTGTFFAAARYASATPVPASVVSRGAGWLGVGVLLNSMFGGITGFTASVENAGLLALTKAGSRTVIQISAGFMILSSIFGKIGAVFASVPLPILSASYCIFFAYISSAGLGFLQFCNLNSFRSKFILGFSLFMGLSVPQYFREYFHHTPSWGSRQSGSTVFRDMVTVFFMSHATVTALVACILDNTLSRQDEEARKDSGANWWEKFRVYDSYVLNDDFYALPFGLNKLFPPH